MWQLKWVAPKSLSWKLTYETVRAALSVHPVGLCNGCACVTVTFVDPRRVVHCCSTEKQGHREILVLFSGILALKFRDNAAAWCMDPRTSWFLPEQLGPSHLQWIEIWEAALGVRTMFLNNDSNVDRKKNEFIPLDFANKLDQKVGPSNYQQSIHNDHFQKRKLENKASTFGLNHSSRVEYLRADGGLTPWKRIDKNYELNPVGWVYLVVYQWDIFIGYIFTIYCFVMGYYSIHFVA